jgi:hypothetical protein
LCATLPGVINFLTNGAGWSQYAVYSDPTSQQVNDLLSGLA